MDAKFMLLQCGALRRNLPGLQMDDNTLARPVPSGERGQDPQEPGSEKYAPEALAKATAALAQAED